MALASGERDIEPLLEQPIRELSQAASNGAVIEANLSHQVGKWRFNVWHLRLIAARAVEVAPTCELNDINLLAVNWLMLRWQRDHLLIDESPDAALYLHLEVTRRQCRGEP